MKTQGAAMEAVQDGFKQEVQWFRSHLKEDALTKAEKSIRLIKRPDGLAIIELDQFEDRANVMSSSMMHRLSDLLLQVEADKKIGALLIISRKPTIFVAGADISEIQKFATGEAKVETLIRLQKVYTFLEELPIPSIAAIHGACMGGGTELALACDYRIASDAKETKIGLPEVMLGVIPGWGGTQRMPRLIGLEKSLDLILSGRAVDGKKAKKMGLVDKVAPVEWLEEKAIAWALEIKQKGQKRKFKGPDTLREKLLENVPGGKWIVFDQAKKQLLAKTKGHYPAPLKALEVIRETYGGPIAKGLAVEAQGFTEMVQTPEARNLLAVYYLNEGVKRSKGVVTQQKPKDIHNSAVVGAGVMGGGIAQLFISKGVRVRMKDIQWDAVTKGYQAAYKVFEKLMKKRKMRPNEVANQMALLEGTTEYTGFKNVELVVEAVVEDLEIKKRVFADLEKVVAPDTILASNTSSLSIGKIAEGTKNPERVVGMHFFNPVDKMPLVEVIRGPQTSDMAAAAVFQLSKKLGKTPILVKDSPGFVVNRILGPYLNEAAYLVLEGVMPSQMDAILEKFGMPMGPCTLLDEIGLDVASKVVKILYGAFGERMKSATLVENIVKEGRLGKKTGRGIYVHSGKSRVEDATLLNKIGKIEKANLSADTIERRLVYLMVNEAARVLEEGVAQKASDIDVGMIFGTGFPPFRGGLLRYADSVGAENIVSDLELFTRNYGTRFAPCNYLTQLATSGNRFYS